MLPAAMVRGVRIDLLDLSLGSMTWTFKDWVACVTVAECLAHGHARAVFQSSGNSGTSLAVYCSDAGILPVFLYPTISRYKLDGGLLGRTQALLIEVKRPEPELKRLAALVANDLAVPQIPTLQHQLEANKLRAYLLIEHFRQTGEWHDWHAQALSSAYGPLGLYKGMEECAGELGRLGLEPPKLFGVQQEAVCPFVRLLEGDLGITIDPNAAVIEPTLFRTEPSADLQAMLRQVLRHYGGRLVALSNAQYFALRDEALGMLAEAGLRLGHSKRDGESVLAEQSGVIALCGVLEAIRRGVFRKGERVQVAITGGCRPDIERDAQPDLIVDARMSDSEILMRVRALVADCRPNAPLAK
jgi:threonine synthase